MRPLQGVVVVALEHAVAAPFATRQLADLGARVIKVERPGSGDFARDYDRIAHGHSSYFVWLNRGKESVALDIKSTGDRAVLDELVGRADVLIGNLGPGALERLGLDAETLRRSHPHLIHCSISGYGQGGPYDDRKAYDLLVQCETGMLSVTGTTDEPAKAGTSIADIAAGMYAYSGILTALYRRERTGEGAELRVAMIDALSEWMAQPATVAAYSGAGPTRSGARHPTIAPYGPFRCGDGTIFLAVQNDREWEALCRDLLGDGALAHDRRFKRNPDRVAHRDALERLVVEATSRLPVIEVEAVLDRGGIAHARLRDADELLTHPQLVARDRWGDVPVPGAESVRGLLPPVQLIGDAPRLGAVPSLGEHTEAVLAELGMQRRR
ncbi:CaiB/BaiF CoA-transferase family protein [Nocardioides sp. AE5]|uniref:CaiB/BaiF CoA transferase family protein n=1 Tax=Nocardioides sp. AE5 TaxID=2962573 RepID=UPI002881B7FB|nr:CaiB/BaiF CoA-transferase family protein [Nocardioides sp. AE5]MDT0203164.1 CaiB/BaiF CoA-transferase family protein [Nocardioides sp. AE5]